MSVHLPVQAAQQGLLFLAIALQQVNSMITGSSAIFEGFTIILLALLVAVVAVIVPLLLRQAARARRYAREHSNLLVEEPAAA